MNARLVSIIRYAMGMYLPLISTLALGAQHRASKPANPEPVLSSMLAAELAAPPMHDPGINWKLRAIYLVLGLITGGLTGAFFSQKLRPLRQWLFLALLAMTLIASVFVNDMLAFGSSALASAFFAWWFLRVTNGMSFEPIFGNARPATRIEIVAAGHMMTFDAETEQFIGKAGIPLGGYIEPDPNKRSESSIENSLSPQSGISCAGDLHLLTVAPARSGKARDTLIPALLSPGIGSAIVVDPKGQLAAVTARHRQSGGGKVINLNPFALFLDRLGPSIGYNPTEKLDPASSSFSADCDSIAQDVIWQTGGDTHWSDSAQMVFSGLVMYFTKYAEPDMRNLISVRAAIAGPLSLFRATIGAAMKTGDILIIERLSRFAEMRDDDREANSILSVLKTQTAFMSNTAIRESLKGAGFTFTDLRENATTVYLVLPGEYLMTCGKWFRLVVGSALRELMQRSKGQRVAFILDEFAQLGQMQALSTAIVLSAGYGIRLWPIVQDLNQLKDLYPKNWETFLANAGAQQFFAARDLTTAEYISNRCGQKTVLVKNTSTREISDDERRKGMSGISHSYSPHAQPLFMPQEVMGMRGDRQLLFLNDVENVVVASRQPYWTLPELADTYDPDPYHTQAHVA